MNILLCLLTSKDPLGTYLYARPSLLSSFRCTSPDANPAVLLSYVLGPLRESRTSYEYIYEGSWDLEPLVIFMA